MVGRFISADVYTTTGQGFAGNNMFVYCGNNSVGRVDITGAFWQEIIWFVDTSIAEAAKAIGTLSPAYAGCLGIAAVDGPVPFGDILGLGISALLTVAALDYGVYKAAAAMVIPIRRDEEKEETKEDVVAETSNIRKRYYHVTTPDAAAVISATGMMIGSGWEGGHIYAWLKKPSQEAIEVSGAHFGVIISFSTDVLFVPDMGVEDMVAQSYGPIVTILPGPIFVWDVEIEG